MLSVPFIDLHLPVAPWLAITSFTSDWSSHHSENRYCLYQECADSKTFRRNNHFRADILENEPGDASPCQSPLDFGVTSLLNWAKTVSPRSSLRNDPFVEGYPLILVTDAATCKGFIAAQIYRVNRMNLQLPFPKRVLSCRSVCVYPLASLMDLARSFVRGPGLHESLRASSHYGEWIFGCGALVLAVLSRQI